MEEELLAWLRRRIPPHRRVRLGPGDDAALIDLPTGAGLLATVDMLMDGVDFELAKIDPACAGRKALAVNLSDLAAMAALPAAALVALALPRAGGQELAQRLYDGLLPLADEFDLPIAGGDVNSWDGPLVISVTAFGSPTERGPLTRGGARPGDAIAVTGWLGGSILGRHLDFTPRVREAIELHRRYDLHAGIDISDGFALDLSRLASASGVGAVVHVDAIPISDAARQCASSAGAATPLEHAMGDGEDFELILAAPREAAEQMVRDRPIAVPLTIVGQFIAEPGLWQATADGRRMPLHPRGWQHRIE